jgi:hypothetical protein
MSDYRIGIVVEGTTDRIVIVTIKDGGFPLRSYPPYIY